MPRALLKVALALASAGAALAVGLALRPEPAEGPTVELVEADIDEIFEARDAELAAAGADAEPAAPAKPADAPAAATAPSFPPLVRLPLREKAASKLFPAIGTSQIYDPDMIARHKPSVIWRRVLAEHPSGGWRLRTNSLGLREDREVGPEKPDLRFLVVGDSHIDGVCDNADSYPHVLEAELARRHPELSVEGLNAWTGGWNFYNYLGAFEALSGELQPDVFVVTVYGGNDFYDGLYLYRYHRAEKAPRTPPGMVASLVKLSKRHMGIAAQYYNQVAFFSDHPEELEPTRAMARSVTREIARQCAERGTRLLCVYLPPLASAQPELYTKSLALAQAHYPVPVEAYNVDDRLADAWLADLEEDGIPAVDLRPAFRAAEEPLYWETDHHINLAGQRLAAEQLVARMEALAEL